MDKLACKWTSLLTVDRFLSARIKIRSRHQLQFHSSLWGNSMARSLCWMPKELEKSTNDFPGIPVLELHPQTQALPQMVWPLVLWIPMWRMSVVMDDGVRRSERQTRFKTIKQTGVHHFVVNFTSRIYHLIQPRLRTEGGWEHWNILLQAQRSPHYCEENGKEREAEVWTYEGRARDLSMKYCVQRWQFFLRLKSATSMSGHSYLWKRLVILLHTETHNNNRHYTGFQKTQVASIFRFFQRCNVLPFSALENPLGEVIKTWSSTYTYF